MTFYLAASFITTLGVFGVVSVLPKLGGEAVALDDCCGLFWNRPWVAMVFTAMLLSLAGSPLTVGFVGKVSVIATEADTSLWLLILLLVINSVIGLFYYLRVIVSLAADGRRGAREAEQAQALHMSCADGLVFAALRGPSFWPGLYPAPLISLVQTMERSFVG